MRPTRRTTCGELIIPESKVQQLIISVLNRMGIANNRVNGGQFIMSGKNKRGTASTRRVKCNSIRGKSDIEAWTFISKDGIRVGIPIYIEVKASHGGKQSDNQKEFEKMLSDRGYYYFIADSLDSFYDGMDAVKEDIESKLPGFEMKYKKVGRR